MNNRPITPGIVDTIAYFSMEIALDPAIPTYSGGLGVLALVGVYQAAQAEVVVADLGLFGVLEHLRRARGRWEI